MSEETTEPTKPTPSRLRPLMEIVADIKRILETSQGEVTKELDELDLEIETKVEAYAVVMRELEAQRIAHTTLSKFYATQAAFREHDIERLKARLDAGMRIVGVTDIRTKTAHAFYRTDKAIEVATAKFRERYLFERPGLFSIKDPEPNKTAIKAVLAANEPLEYVNQVVRSSLQFR